MNDIDANILTAAQHLRSAVALLQAAKLVADDNGDDERYYKLHSLAQNAQSLLNDTQEQLK